MQYDVAVAGGSVAGLSAALVLAQAQRRVLVVDGGQPRNAPAAQLHGYLGRDGDSPSQLLADGRDEVRRHGGEFRVGTVVSATALDAGFDVALEDGEQLTTRTLVVATGLTDHLPQLDGVAEGWGRDVVHCPYCHGVELAGRPLGVLGGSPMDVARAQMVRQWSTDVTLFSNTATLTDDDHAALSARGVQVIDAEVVGLVRDDADALRTVALDDGTHVARDAIFIWAPPRPNDALLQTLGVPTQELPLFGSWPQVEADGRTCVPGLWAVGNVADPHLNLIAATAHGAYAAAMLNHGLVHQEVAAAVDDHR